MKRMYVAFACLYVTNALAGSRAADDYVACVIGKAAVALHSQTTKDAGEAQSVAYKRCRPRGKIDELDAGVEGITDYINMMVEKMAKD